MLAEQTMKIWLEIADKVFGKPLAKQAELIAQRREELTSRFIARQDVPSAGSPMHNLATMVEREAMARFLDKNGGIWCLYRLEYVIEEALKAKE